MRTQITEGLNMAGGAKVPVVDAYTNSGTAPADRTAAGMSPDATDTKGNYVSAVEITNGRVDITFGGPRAHQAIFGQRLSVTPYETNGNTVVWRCGNAAQPAGVPLQNGAMHLAPEIEARYLPNTCR
ncbi:MAG: pilin [Gammaproteobacteria bacterium]|nr:pilin [Gammaproteobacteria bacterium]